jgi:hypothetical protein
MNNVLRTTFAAALGLGACVAVASTSASAAPLDGVTQDLSARTCRTVTTHTWRHGHRVAVKRTSCSPSYSYGYGARQTYGYGSNCRYIMKTTWRDGRRISVRTRVCG